MSEVETTSLRELLQNALKRVEKLEFELTCYRLDGPANTINDKYLDLAEAARKLREAQKAKEGYRASENEARRMILELQELNHKIKEAGQVVDVELAKIV